jgi:hypothetical protein
MRRKSAQFDLGGSGVALLLAELDHRIRKLADEDRSSGQASALDECRRLPGQADSPDYFMLVDLDRPFARIDESQKREHADSIHEAVTDHLIADHEGEMK